MPRFLTEPEKAMFQQVILPVIAVGTDGSYRPVGRTMASSLWPAYSFNIEALRGDDNEQLTLVDLARLGWIDDKSNGPAHFRMAQAPTDNSGGIITWDQ